MVTIALVLNVVQITRFIPCAGKRGAKAPCLLVPNLSWL